MELRVAIPMTQRAFYPGTAISANKARMESIGKKYARELEQASMLTNVPLPLLLAVTFTESAGQAQIVSSAGAVGLMQLKPQTANDVIFLESQAGRLSSQELNVLRRHLGKRLDGPLKQKYLSHKIRENNFSGNALTRTDLQTPELNLLLGAMLLGILIDQHREGASLRLDKALVRYNRGYFFKLPSTDVERTLDFVKGKSGEAYAYALKVIGRNGLLETVAT
jgi:soluble lytic murein transglycosylase-like protein